ncbi:MAG: SDR family oxidoreductase [Chloroflexi bacterium]|nr:SDR family oxidoreductase [Chloroflexota bacterium]MCI0647350.1 SDR family oxidoreductase [Chloroflexota bacterium]MCI0727810.1 SDR family oxidoreductase [Chloroflexota bacterium]
MDLGLKDKIALVAASSRGLGLAAALELAREGAKVVISGRDDDRLEEARQQLFDAVGPGAAVAALRADVAVREEAERLVEQAAATFGGLDILITNAGGPPGGTFDTLDLDAWEKGVRLTLMSAVYLIRAALPHLRHSQAASILTVTSVSVKQPIPNLFLSNAIRPAVAGLTKSLSQELGPEGIRVNSILPGWTATERVEEIMTYNAGRNQTTIGEEKAKVTAAVPLGRMGRPEEFGKVAAFLVSPAASYVTGVMLLVDGGRYSGLL